MTAPDPAIARRVALASRILAHQGLSEDILGHVSVRQGDGMLIRCRGPQESGLLFSVDEDVRPVDFDGALTGEGGDRAVPKEWPIHAALYRARPDVGAVIHAHPPWVVALDLAGIDLVPLVGAYDIPAARMAAEGIPTFPRSALIKDPDLAAEMLESMGDAPACILRGHGITTAGATLEEALARALSLQSLALMAARVAQLGGSLQSISEVDLAQLPDLGSAFNDVLMWQHCVARLEHDGHGLSS